MNNLSLFRRLAISDSCEILRNLRVVLMVKSEGNELLACFKAYDIRGRLGDELNEDIAYRIGRAYAVYLNPKTVVIGADVRHSSEGLKMALAKGLMDEGVDVIDIGMTGTEEVYFATFHLGGDGGIEVTASHNPMDYNGMKLVRSGSRPISGDTGLHEIHRIAEANQFAEVRKRGTYIKQDVLPAFVDHLMTYIDLEKLRPLKLVVNAGNGAAGHVIDVIEQVFMQRKIPVSFIKIHHEPDGSFPNGIPNPLLPENRAATAEAVLAHQADMGIAWDGDFDRCFLFDEHGEFIEGYYIVGLLAAAFLAKHPHENIIHDPRLIWNTQDIVAKSGGHAIMSKTGHAFIKERMRLENAIYGGEMSAHHYFRDFAYCDSGMIPWLLVCELLSQTGQSLSALVAERIALFPCSGEINFKVANVANALSRIQQHFMPESPSIDETDGLSMAFTEWRFNLRGSNTEPLLRLNVESRADAQLVQKKVDEISNLISSL
jgi:phosphomannomutase